jgi:hypothetical protein
MSMALLQRCLTVLFAIPAAHELLVCMGVEGCGCPISVRVVRNEAASLPLWKRMPSLASAAEDTTTFRIVHGTCPGPLWGGGSALGSNWDVWAGCVELRNRVLD